MHYKLDKILSLEHLNFDDIFIIYNRPVFDLCRVNEGNPINLATFCVP